MKYKLEIYNFLKELYLHILIQHILPYQESKLYFIIFLLVNIFIKNFSRRNGLINIDTVFKEFGKLSNLIEIIIEFNNEK